MARGAELVRIERHRDVGIIVIDNPPVNALSHGVRRGLLAAIEALDADPLISAIVLHGAGRNFSAGADVRELDRPSQPPLLNEVLRRLERATKPVVAALHGAVLGGGAEAALASHYRCAAGDLQIGFPEVKLGVLPGAGGTVRLPRLVGVRTALDLMTRGDAVGRERAAALGLIDRPLDGELKEGALTYARELLASGAGVRRTRDRRIEGGESATAQLFAEYRTGLPRAARRVAAAESIIQCVEAAVAQPFDAALGRARELFEACRASRESGALRHLFFAERGAALAREHARAVGTVGVVGAGTMGVGIALACAQAGIEVVLMDVDARALDAGLERLRSMLGSAARKGRMSPEAADATRARVRGAHEIAALAEADLVIEAVFERLEVKREVFGRLGAVCRLDAILATNTSTLDVEAIAAASGRPDRVIGMHFFTPAHVMRLVEVVRTPLSSPQALHTALAVCRRLGKIGVVVGNAFGFVGNRMLYAYGREKELMLLEGATPERIDRALEDFGMAMGPNAVGDLAGLDIGVAARRQWRERPDDPCFYRASDLLVEHGRLGQKSGRGFYRYDGVERRRESDPDAIELIRLEAQRLGVRRREVPDEEIVDRCIVALINEGARLLDAGIASRAADIDVIWCNGYGFPRSRGGPMFHADTVGLSRVVAVIERCARERGPRYWQPAPLLTRLAACGGRLAAWTADAGSPEPVGVPNG